MNGILILAHGSREKETENTLEQIVEMLKVKADDCFIQTAFLQFSDTNLEKGLDLLVQKGINNITVVPYFLFEGVHIIEDIPNEINEYLEKNKSITIKMSKVLGVDQRLADILFDRIKESI